MSKWRLVINIHRIVYLIKKKGNILMVSIHQVDGYQYFAIGIGAICMIPQIYLGYKTGKMQDVSSFSISCIFISTLLWGIYLYQEGYRLYLYITGFVCISSMVVLLLQLFQYYKRFQEHVRTFESKPEQPKIKTEPKESDSLSEQQPNSNNSVVQQAPSPQIIIVPQQQVQQQPRQNTQDQSESETTENEVNITIND